MKKIALSLLVFLCYAILNVTNASTVKTIPKEILYVYNNNSTKISELTIPELSYTRDYINTAIQANTTSRAAR